MPHHHHTLQSHAAPIWSRFSASHSNSSDRNGPENNLSSREATYHAPPHAPIKAAICPGTACTYVTCPPQVPPTELRPAASAAHCVRPAEHTERVDRKRARQPAGSTGGRAGARPTCSHCYALVRACSNFNRLQLCSRAAPGPRNCSPRTAIAKDQFWSPATPRLAPPLCYQKPRCRSTHQPTVDVVHDDMARRRRRSRCARCDADRSARQ